MRRFLIGLVVTAVCAALLFRLIPWSSTEAALQAADPRFIALAVTCLVASLVAKTVRWRLLLPEGSAVSTTRLYRILHISFLLNNVLPARLGDVARVAMTTRQPGIRFGHVISSMLTERVTDMVTLLTGFLLISPFLPVPDGYEPWLRAAWVIFAAMACVALGATLFRERIGLLARHDRIVARLPRKPAAAGRGLVIWRRVPPALFASAPRPDLGLVLGSMDRRLCDQLPVDEGAPHRRAIPGGGAPDLHDQPGDADPLLAGVHRCLPRGRDALAPTFRCRERTSLELRNPRPPRERRAGEPDRRGLPLARP
ncbi:MAG: flippase-like domain-containing protein [Dehalococcoidia bacterium]|nr:flippase-like domain-containing protein [Dehalococcoidia bacterium]